MAYYPPAHDSKRPPIILSYHEPPSGPPPYSYHPSGPPPQMEPYSPPSEPPPQMYPPPSGPPQLAYSESGSPSDANYLIQSFPPVPDVARRFNTPRLRLPFCVPQLMPGFDGPFCRAYNPTLESLGIPQEQILAFIDGLNIAMSESPPLRVVDLAGMGIAYAPYHWADTTTQTGTWADMRVLSKTTTDLYLRAANLRLFKPRGLSVRICTAAAVQHLVMGAPIVPPPSKITRVGRGGASVPMNVPIPLASLLAHAKQVPGMAPTSRQSTRLQAAQRRAATLHGYALPLDFDMPQSVHAHGVMDTVSRRNEDLRPEYEQRQQGYRGPSQQGYGGPSQSSRGGLIGGLLRMGSDQLQHRASNSGGDRFQSQAEYDNEQRRGPSQRAYRGPSQPRRKGLISGLISMGSEQLQQRGSGQSNHPQAQYEQRRQGYGGPSQSGRGGLTGGLMSMGSDQLQQRGSNRGGGDRFDRGSGRRDDSSFSDDEDRRGGKRASRRDRRRDRRDRDRKPGLVGLLGGLVMSHVGGQGGGTPSSGGGQTSMGGRAVNLGGGGDRRNELQVADADLIEHWQSSKVLWVVIVDSDMDEAIEGIERAESREDEERVEEQTWQAEMNLERADRDFAMEMEHFASSQAQPQNSRAGESFWSG
ncbi:hypothetical protein DFH06DRAFT_1295183 [Mycena polygramma]|nr:hypothetical protein DFH06DRAFT_1295183 [Mycena polygramma]